MTLVESMERVRWSCFPGLSRVPRLANPPAPNRILMSKRFSPTAHNKMASLTPAQELEAAQVLQAAARHQLYVQDFGPVSVVAEGIDSDYVAQHINPLLEEGLEALLREVERVGEVGVSPDDDSSSTVLNPTRWLAQWLMRNNTSAVSNADQSDLVAFAHRKHDEILHETGDSRAWIRTLVATQSAVDQQFNGLSMRDVFRAMDRHRDGRVSVDDFVKGMVERPEMWTWFCDIIGRSVQDKMSKTEIKAVMVMLDANGDKYISWEEFHKFVNDKLLQRIKKKEKTDAKKAGKRA